MPKKSREQKMLADIRRRVRTERVISTPASSIPIQEHASTFKFIPSGQVKRQEVVSRAATGELTAIKKDLVKTIVLATIAISAELVLYFLSKGRI